MSRPWIALALVVLPALACTQRPVRIVGPDGRGLVGIDIHGKSGRGEPWRRLGVTDEFGLIQLPIKAGAILRFVSLEYETRVLLGEDLEGGDPVVLRPQALLLPGLTVTSPRAACISADDPVARDLWERAAETHRGPWDTVGLAAYGSFHAGSVSFEDRSLAPPDLSDARVMALGYSHSIHENILEHGYAWRFRTGLRGIWEGQDFGYWYYPRFDLFHAYHLTSTLFGQLNRFTTVGEGTDGTRIAFCGIDRERPFVLGVLTLRNDRIVHAIWSFSTPDRLKMPGAKPASSTIRTPPSSRPPSPYSGDPRAWTSPCSGGSQ